MEPVTDWVALWAQLVEMQAKSHPEWHGREKVDVWKTRARNYDALVKNRWSKPDSSRAFIAADLEAAPGSTALDIGAGTGAWSMFMARHASRVTALEPSTAMLGILRENLAREGVTNVDFVQGEWPAADVPEHDISLCSHAMYGVADFPAFIRRMEAATRRRCYLVLRVPTPDGVMAEAARRVWGQPHDSPNFQVAYNALLQMGVCANVLMEDSGLWSPWTSESLEEAVADIKRRLDVGETSGHDAFLWDLVERRLTPSEDGYTWPPGVRSALVYWDVA